MREREVVSRVARSVPPPELRQFTDGSRPEHLGADLGCNVYPDRAAWLAARREWEQANGLTLRAWFDEMITETREAGATLDEFNWATSVFLIEAEDFRDPRTDPLML